MSNRFSLAISMLNDDNFKAFAYLKIANECLSNPVEEREGRELVIRALNDRPKFSTSDNVLRALVRKSGLYPYLSSEFDTRSVYEDFVLDMYKSTHAPNFVFHSVQFKIFRLLLDGHNVVLSAPTSMGKSAIVDALLASEKYRRVVIVVPTVALIDETRRRVSAKFGRIYSVIHHASQRIRRNKKTVFILTQERVNERTDIDQVDIFIIDEFYKLAFGGVPDERAVALNVALSKLLMVSKQFYMIGPHIDEVRGLGVFNKKYYFVPANFNTVAVNVCEYNIAANDIEGKNARLLEILRASDLVEKKQTIVYCKSPPVASEIARFLVSSGLVSKIKSNYVDWVKRNYSEYWSYFIAISNGIGIHHGALPRAIQQYTVDMFNTKQISILICTSTIIEGVNTNAEDVIIYDNRNGTGSIDRFTHNNIKGRAGRMKVHFVGNVHCFEKIPVETLESRVVEVPLGLQDDLTPLNMLAGIDASHLSTTAADRYENFLQSNNVPLDLMKKHSNFDVDNLRTMFDHVVALNTEELDALCFSGFPSSIAAEQICFVLRLVAGASLRNYNLRFENGDLKNKFIAYLYADSYQEYISVQTEWLAANYDGVQISNGIDRELKIIRNFFGFTVPKVLAALQDVVNSVSSTRSSKRAAANYSLMLAIFENNHLPANLAALEEMGIPIQTLEKIRVPRLEGVELDVLTRYMSWNFEKLSVFDEMDRMFIRNALVPRRNHTDLDSMSWQRITD